MPDRERIEAALQPNLPVAWRVVGLRGLDSSLDVNALIDGAAGSAGFHPSNNQSRYSLTFYLHRTQSDILWISYRLDQDIPACELSLELAKRFSCPAAFFSYRVSVLRSREGTVWIAPAFVAHGTMRDHPQIRIPDLQNIECKSNASSADLYMRAKFQMSDALRSFLDLSYSEGEPLSSWELPPVQARTVPERKRFEANWRTLCDAHRVEVSAADVGFELSASPNSDEDQAARSVLWRKIDSRDAFLLESHARLYLKRERSVSATAPHRGFLSEIAKAADDILTQRLVQPAPDPGAKLPTKSVPAWEVADGATGSTIDPSSQRAYPAAQKETLPAAQNNTNPNHEEDFVGGSASATSEFQLVFSDYTFTLDEDSLEIAKQLWIDHAELRPQRPTAEHVDQLAYVLANAADELGSELKLEEVFASLIRDNEFPEIDPVAELLTSARRDPNAIAPSRRNIERIVGAEPVDSFPLSLRALNRIF